MSEEQIQEGMKMIQFLQKMAGIDESDEDARLGWLCMSDHGREWTRITYDILKQEK